MDFFGLRCQRFKLLSAEAKQVYYDMVTAGRARVRGMDGKWRAAGKPPGVEAEHPQCVAAAAGGRKRSSATKKGSKRLGVEVLTQLSGALESPEKSRQGAAQEILTRTAINMGMSYAHARRLVPGGTHRRLWARGGKASEGKVGRPEGSLKISTGDLKILLLEHCRESSKWSCKAKAPMRVLQGSKRQVHGCNPRMKELYCYRQFCRKLQGGKLGIGKGSKRVDYCDYCEGFDEEAKKLGALLLEYRERLEGIEKGFWTEWDRHVEEHAAYQDAGFIAEASPTYLEDIVGYVQGHTVATGAKDEGIIFAKEMAAWIVLVKAYGAHWQLRDNQDAACKRHMKEPMARTLYILWDMQEP